jgi:hypothetical protein
VSRMIACVVGLPILLALAGTVVAQGRPPQLHKYRIVNDSGETIFLAIVGHQPGVIWRPDGDGTLAAAGRDKEARAPLREGDRAVMVWDRRGNLIWIESILVDAPGTIQIGKGGEVICTDENGKQKKSTPLFKKGKD